MTRIVVFVGLTWLLLPACRSDQPDTGIQVWVGGPSVPAVKGQHCEDEAACDEVGRSAGLGNQHIVGRQSVTFVSGGARYSLVHYEYGVGQDCPAGCFYSHLCAFVVGGRSQPIYFSFTTESEVLPAVAAFCAPRQLATSDAKCALPGLALPIMSDSSFRAWVESWTKDASHDEMRWCRDPLANAYLSNELPRVEH